MEQIPIPNDLLELQFKTENEEFVENRDLKLVGMITEKSGTTVKK
jgi:hypothetical protein